MSNHQVIRTEFSEQARKNLVRLMAKQIPKYEAAERKEANKPA